MIGGATGSIGVTSSTGADSFLVALDARGRRTVGCFLGVALTDMENSMVAMNASNNGVLSYDGSLVVTGSSVVMA